MAKKKSTLTICCKSNPLEDEADYICEGEDDQKPINEAIQALSETGGKVMLLPGTYNTSAPIMPNVDNLEIAGLVRGATLIKPTVDIQAGIFHDKSATSEEPRTELNIHDLTLDGSNQAKGNISNKAIYIAYLRRALFENLHVYNTGSTGIGVDFLFESVIRSNIVEKCGFPFGQTGNAGIGIGTGGDREEPLLIFGNHVEECGLAGIMLEAQQSEKGKILHHIVSNNVVRYNAQYGILMRGLNQALIATNMAIGNGKDGICMETYKEMAPVHVLIGNNISQGNGGFGVNIKSLDADNIQVLANNLSGNKAGSFNSDSKKPDISHFNNSSSENNHIIGNLSVTGKEINFEGIPTRDPHVRGQLWNDDGTVRISKV